MILQDIIDIIEHAAPLKWQEGWDNSGLQVGERNAQVNAVLLTTDVTEAVVSEAIAKHCELVLSHHPLLYHKLKSVTGRTAQERIVQMAIKHDVAIYSSHTPMDSWIHGVSGRMAKKLGMQNVRLLTGDEEHGLGVIGELSQPMRFGQWLQEVKAVFGATYIRYVEPREEWVSRIALCGGAGSEFVEDAIAQGADVFLSADCKYHEMEAVRGRIGLVDIDHWISEHFTREVFEELLAGKVKTVMSEKDETPVKVL